VYICIHIYMCAYTLSRAMRVSIDTFALSAYLICVYMHAYICVCMYINPYICTCIYMHIYIYICLCVCVYLSRYSRVSIDAFALSASCSFVIYMCLYIFMHTGVYLCILAYICMCKYMHVCVLLYFFALRAFLYIDSR